MTDSGGLTDEKTYTINVANVNDPPVIANASLPNATQDMLYSALISVNDPDAGDTHTYELLKKPSWMAIDETTGALSGTPENSDVVTGFTITVKITDSGGLTDEKTFTINVINVNDPPAVKNASLKDAIQFTPYSEQITVNDPDLGDSHTYELLQKPLWMMINANTGTISGTPSSTDVQSGVMVRIRVTDRGGLSNEKTFTLNVLPKTYTISGTITGASDVNVTLRGDTSADQSVNDGMTYSFTVVYGGTYTVKPSKIGYLFESVTFTNVTSDVVRDFAAVPVIKTHTISGTVTGADGVTFTLSGGDMGSQSGGSYSFNVDEGGTYTVTPTAEGYTFEPPSATFGNVTSDISTNFMAVPILNTYTISGTVTGAEGVTFTLSGITTGSKSGENYAFTVDEGGTYTITPTANGYKFEPPSATFTDVTSDISTNFMAVPIINTYTISGTVTGAEGVKVTLSGGAMGSQNGGSYAFTVDEGDTYTITPTAEGYSFEPPSATFGEVTSDITQIFTAQELEPEPSQVTISGTVSGADDVTFTLSGGATGSQSGGSYAFTVDEGGTFTVTPSAAGYSFEPPSATFTEVTSDVTRNFTAQEPEPSQITISGTITGADDVTFTLSGGATGSQSGGSYAFTVDEGGTYTVTPSAEGYSFNPPSATFTDITSDISQNFTAQELEPEPSQITISGTITGADDVTFTLSGGATGSQSGGSYAFTVAEGGTYTVTPSAAGYTFDPPSTTFTEVTSDVTRNFTANVFEPQPSQVTISGTVTGADDVTFTLSGGATGNQSGGSYAFTVDEGGTYTVTPSAAGYTFDPPSATFTEVTSDVTRNFTANMFEPEPSQVTILGTVTGADDVTFTLSGGDTGSQSGGSYAFTVDEGGTYTITPSADGYSFDPPSATFTDVTSDITRNFTAQELQPSEITISGTVTGADDVTFTLSGGATGNQSGGSYSFTVNEGGTYTVTPSAAGYTFDPPGATFENATSNITQNFDAVLNTYILSGTVSDIVPGVGSVTVTLVSGDV